jgi:hypothetical protein
MSRRLLTLVLMASFLAIGCSSSGPRFVFSGSSAPAATCAGLDWNACGALPGCMAGAGVDADGTRVFRCASRFSDAHTGQAVRSVMLGALASSAPHYGP